MALSDLKYPGKIIFRCDDWVFDPEMDHEMIGDEDMVGYYKAMSLSFATENPTGV